MFSIKTACLLHYRAMRIYFRQKTREQNVMLRKWILGKLEKYISAVEMYSLKKLTGF